MCHKRQIVDEDPSGLPQIGDESFPAEKLIPSVNDESRHACQGVTDRGSDGSSGDPEIHDVYQYIIKTDIDYIATEGDEHRSHRILGPSYRSTQYGGHVPEYHGKTDYREVDACGMSDILFGTHPYRDKGTKKK